MREMMHLAPASIISIVSRWKTTSNSILNSHPKIVIDMDDEENLRKTRCEKVKELITYIQNASSNK